MSNLLETSSAPTLNNGFQYTSVKTGCNCRRRQHHQYRCHMFISFLLGMPIPPLNIQTNRPEPQDRRGWELETRFGL